MQAAHIPPDRLQALRQFLADATPAQGLDRQVMLVARLVGAASCSVMLLGSPDEPDACMSIQAHHGPLPDAALQAAIRRGEGISGSVLAKGSAVLVSDIAHSEFAALARRRAAVGASLMSAPIRIDGRVVGVINSANGAGAAPFLPGAAFAFEAIFTALAACSEKMSPLGSVMPRCLASRSTNCRATISSSVLEALLSSMPWFFFNNARTSWLVVLRSSATL